LIIKKRFIKLINALPPQLDKLANFLPDVNIRFCEILTILDYEQSSYCMLFKENVLLPNHEESYTCFIVFCVGLHNGSGAKL
jgi:hypothetical protein